MTSLPQQIECSPGPGCAVGVAVVHVASEVERVEEDLAEEKARTTSRVEGLHRRIDRVEDRFNAILVGVAMTFLSTIVNIAVLLLRK